MPLEVESVEQAKAWLAYGLKSVPIKVPPGWLAEGRDLQHLLPWVRQRAENAPRLQCIVDRELFRPLAKRLREYVARTEVGTTASVRFREGILRILVGSELFAVAAHGEPWNLTILVDPSGFRLAQARLRFFLGLDHAAKKHDRIWNAVSQRT